MQFLPAALEQRRDTLEIYIKRLQKIEEIVNSYEGIKQSFAVQAGREVRIIVEAEDLMIWLHKNLHAMLQNVLKMNLITRVKSG